MLLDGTTDSSCRRNVQQVVVLPTSVPNPQSNHPHFVFKRSAFGPTIGPAAISTGTGETPILDSSSDFRSSSLPSGRVGSTTGPDTATAAAAAAAASLGLAFLPLALGRRPGDEAPEEAREYARLHLPAPRQRPPRVRLALHCSRRLSGTFLLKKLCTAGETRSLETDKRASQVCDGSVFVFVCETGEE